MEKNEMPPSLQAALIPIFVALLSSLTVYLKAEVKAEDKYVVATAMASLAAVAYAWFMDRRQRKTIVVQEKKLGRAEEIAPGITAIPPGSETKATIIISDPNVPNIEKETPKTS